MNAERPTVGDSLDSRPVNTRRKRVARGARWVTWPQRGTLALVIATMCFSCKSTDNYLGHDMLSASGEPIVGAAGNSSTNDNQQLCTGDCVDAGSGQGSSDNSETNAKSPAEPESGNDPAESKQDAEPEPADNTTLDASAGRAVNNTEIPDATAPLSDEPLIPLAFNPKPINHFVETLGLEKAEVSEHVQSAFEQLFFGDPETEAIYFELDDTHAYIQDVLHEDTRADAIGFGLIVTVLLDHQLEFDKIWTFTYERLRVQEGLAEGYFHQRCTLDSEPCSRTISSFGAFYITTALLLAEARWGNGPALAEYGRHARDQLALMRQEATDDSETRPALFDFDARLPFARAVTAASGRSAGGINMPAFFEYWGAKTADPVWTGIARESRLFLRRAPHEVTGLVPRISTFDGQAIEGQEAFNEDSYGFLLHLALDSAWYAADAEQVDLADRIIRFFSGLGDPPYPADYSYSGEAQGEYPSGALTAANGSLAAIATVPARTDFIRRVWRTRTPIGLYRYFDGVHHLLSLIYLSGQYRAF